MRRSSAIGALVLGLAAGGAAAAGDRPLAVRPLPGLRAEAATLLVEGIAGGALPLAALALAEEARPAEGGGFLLPLSIEVAGAPLVDRPADEPAAGGRLDFEIYVYAVAAGGSEVAGHLARAVSADLSRLGEALYGVGIRLAPEIAVPAGRHSLRFLVFEPDGRRYGLRSLEIELPFDPSGPAPPPRFEEPCAAWVETGGGGDRRRARPAAMPVVRGGEPVLLRPPPGRRGTPVAARLQPHGDGEVHQLPAAEAAGGADGGPRLTVEIPALPAGRYELVLELGADGARHSQPQPLWILPPAADDGCPPSWAEVLRRAGEGPPVPAAPPEPIEPGERRRIRKAYLEILGDLGRGGDFAGATRRLAELEAGLMEADARVLEGLREVESAAVRDLAARDAEILPPVLALHQSAYEEHLARTRYALASHSRELIAELVSRPPDGGRGGTPAALLADALASLAARSERRQMFFAAEALLERALRLEPGHLESRFLLALLYQRLGRYDAARRQLEALLEVHPGHAEARLRQALLLARAGDPEAAAGELRRLLAERPPPWIRSLARQALGRLLLDAGRFDAAASELARDLAGSPDEARQRLLLAYSLDRAGRAREAEAVLAGLAAAGGVEVSPRRRFSEPPEELLAPLRARLEQGVVVRLPRLARVLDELPHVGSAR